MQAIELKSGHIAFRDDYPAPQPAAGEVLIRVLKAGICETDLQLVRGYMGFAGVLGHEFVGVAETGQFAGRRVVGEINCVCGNCEYCEAGFGNHCPHRSVLGILNRDGAFAEFVALPERNLHPVPDGVPNEAAVFVEPLAAAFQIPAQIELKMSDRVVVLGDGRLGNLCGQVIAQSGCRLTVVGKHLEKLALLQARGIETVLLDEVGDERTADIVVDCTGSPTGLPTAMRLVKPRGTIVLKTTVAGEQTLSLAPLVIDEIQLTGSRCGPFPAAIEALERGEVDVSPLISARFPLQQAETAFEQAASRGVLKVLFDVGRMS